MECQNAFDNLKELCTTTPILAYADFVKPFKLNTDASVLGLGAVLYQVYESVKKVISYTSRSSTKSETKYPVHKLEFLCLKWAITEQFHEYLCHEVSMNIAGIGTFLFPMEFLCFCGKIPSLLHF